MIAALVVLVLFVAVAGPAPFGLSSGSLILLLLGLGLTLLSLAWPTSCTSFWTRAPSSEGSGPRSRAGSAADQAGERQGPSIATVIP